MKVSEITTDTLRSWFGILAGEEEQELLSALATAVNIAKSYTGLTSSEIDEHEDIALAVVYIAKKWYLHCKSVDEENFDSDKVAGNTCLPLYRINFL
jgi:hypothetical protein